MVKFELAGAKIKKEKIIKEKSPKKPIITDPGFTPANKINKPAPAENEKRIKITDLNLSAPIKQFYLDSGIPITLSPAVSSH